jgi:hypothetical protein
MPELNWTPSLVEERLVEAAAILRRLPEQRIRGYFNTWPTMNYEFSDLIGQEMPRPKGPWPAPDAISRMEETLTWTIGLDQATQLLTSPRHCRSARNELTRSR